MVGRDVELEALCGDLAAAASGAGRCTVIEGEPGIGKSRLVEEALARTGGELRVLTAVTVELEHDRPFAPLLRVFPVTTSMPVAAEAVAGGFDRTWRMVDALVDAVEQAAAEAPLALVVEDVHWADTPTVMTLGELARRVAALPALFSALDVIDVASATGREREQVAAVYFALGQQLQLNWLRERILRLPRDDRWQALARAALRDDLYAVRASLTAEVLQVDGTAQDSDELIRRWFAHNQQAVDRCLAVLRDIAAADRADLATLSVALREVRGLVSSRSGVAEH